MSSLTLVVMAAGIGSRYGGLKQIDPVGPSGEVVLDYSVFDALRAGFDRVVFIIRGDIEEAFRERIGRRIERAADTAYVLQSLDQLPPGFAVSRRGARSPGARPRPSWPARTPCDALRWPSTPTTTTAGRPSRPWPDISAVPAEAGRRDFAMVGYRLANTLSEHGTVARGVCTATADGDLVGIRELLKIKRFPDGIKHTENDVDWMPLEPGSWTSMNFWGFTPDLFGELERRFPGFLEANARADREGGVPHPRGRRRAHPREAGPGPDPADAGTLVRRHLSRGPAASSRRPSASSSRRASIPATSGPAEAARKDKP